MKPTIGPRRRTVAGIVACLILSVVALGSGRAAASDALDPNPALNEPDRSNWEIFVEVCQAAPDQSQVAPGKTSNDAIWETWADDAYTFPASPDPKNPPTWQARPQAHKILRPSTQQLFRSQLKAENVDSTRRALGRASVSHGLGIDVGGSEEVRRNEASFTFIVQNSLWYTQGLATAFAKGAPVVFPIGSIEVKAEWTPLSDPSLKSKYHWNYDANGTLYGLTALHVMSKRLPNWTWATFEWVGNAGRCDIIGCHDAFGSTPHDIPSNSRFGGQYPAGDLTPEVLAMFRAAGLGAEWQNYRLKGSQTDFTTSTGVPTLLGNSVTEKGFVQTASCITCHGRATADADGNTRGLRGFTPDGQSYNGAPDPSWYYNTSTNPWTLQYLQMDFVWGFAAASPAQSP